MNSITELRYEAPIAIIVAKGNQARLVLSPSIDARLTAADEAALLAPLGE